MRSSLPSNQTDVIANEYTSVVNNESTLLVPDRGGCACTDIAPAVPTESQMDNLDLVYTLDADGSIDGYLQMFRASADNVRALSLAISGNTAGESIIDSFQEYVDTTDLLNTYEYDGDWHFEPYFNSDATGKWIEMYLNRRGDGMSVYRDLSLEPRDISGFNAISFKYQTGSAGTSNKLRLVISDGNNEAYKQFSNDDVWEWQTKELQISAFTGIGLVDTTSITYIGILAQLARTSTTIMFRDLILTGGSAENTTNISIYDFGPVSNPPTMGTKLVNSEHQIDINPTKTLENYKIDVSGLVLGEYYGIYIEKPDTGTVTLYGTAAKTYSSGRTYTVIGSNITESTGSLAFMVKSETPARLGELRVIPDADPVGSKIVIFSTDDANNNCKFYVEKAVPREGVLIPIKDTYPEEVILGGGRGLMIQYSDNIESQVNTLTIQAKYYYNSIETNG